MKKIKLFLIGLLLLLTLAIGGPLYPADDQASQAEPETKPSDAASRLEKITPVSGAVMPVEIKKGLAKQIEMVLMGDAEIRSFLKTIATLGNLNIVAHRDVTGRMAIFLGKLENITVGDLLEIVLLTNDLGMEIKGNIINVMQRDRFKSLYGRIYDDNRQFKIIPLKYIAANMAKDIISNITSGAATIIANDVAKHLIIVEYPKQLNQMIEVLEKADIPLETRVFELNYAKAMDIKTLFEQTKMLTEVGQIRVAPQTYDKIFITDTLDKLDEISNLIKEIDIKPRQVMIEIRMIQITLKDIFYMGVDWDKIFSGKSQLEGVHLVGRYPFPGDAIKTIPGNTFEATVGTIPADNFEGTIRLLESYGTLKAISSPRLITLNNKPAKFLVGRQDAYVDSTVTTSEAGTTQSTDVQFIDVGITLTVTPTINADNFITMHLEPEISAVTERLPTSTGDSIPLLQKTNVRLDVIVKNGVTIVIAGLIRDEEREAETGIPILKNIPLIGAFFRQTGKVTEKTETVIFLTPYIISGDVDDSWRTKQKEMERKKPKEIREIK